MREFDFQKDAPAVARLLLEREIASLEMSWLAGANVTYPYALDIQEKAFRADYEFSLAKMEEPESLLPADAPLVFSSGLDDGLKALGLSRPHSRRQLAKLWWIDGMAHVEGAECIAQKAMAIFQGQAIPRYKPQHPLFEGANTTPWLADGAGSPRDVTPQKMFSELVREYQKSREYGVKNGTITEKHFERMESLFRIWMDIVGDVALAKLDKDAVRAFREGLKEYPANKTKKFGNKPWAEIQMLPLSEKGRLFSAKTINDHLVQLSAMMKWAKNEGVWKGENPFEGMAIKGAKSKKKPVFSNTELETLFKAPVFTGYLNRFNILSTGKTKEQTGLFWLSLIGLFTGARVAEVWQIQLMDIQQEAGHWYFNLSGEEKKVKTESSRRRIPIHAKLIDLGLLKYVAQLQREGKDSLFYDIPNAREAGRRFQRLVDSQGLKKAGLGFHSFRHSFVDACRRANIPEEVRKTITGHKPKDIGSYYGQGYDVPTLAGWIGK